MKNEYVTIMIADVLVTKLHCVKKVYIFTFRNWVILSL